MSTTLAAALSVLALLAAPLTHTVASPIYPRDEEIYASELAELLAAMPRPPSSVSEADPALQARFLEWINAMQQQTPGEALPIPQALQNTPPLHSHTLGGGGRLLPRPANLLGSESEAIDDKDKRGNYMSLCHFKICNMGRKRNLRTQSIPAWVRQ